MAWGLGIKTCTQPMGEHSRFVWLTYNLMAESFERICTPSEKRHANRKSLVRWVASGRNPMGQTLIGVFRRGVSPKETMSSHVFLQCTLFSCHSESHPCARFSGERLYVFSPSAIIFLSLPLL